MKENIQTLPERSRDKQKENRKFLTRLKKLKPRNLDQMVNNVHHEVFSRMDCLECANCCKTTGPLFIEKDIERLASFLKIKPAMFVEKYLRIDEDNDYVLQQVPCPFLNDDNSCSVYDVRPRACREYPHTDQPKFNKALNVTLKNTAICPAVFEIVERLKKEC